MVLGRVRLGRPEALGEADERHADGAAGRGRGSRSNEASGSPTDGSPLSMWPTMATPDGSKISTTTTPNATATSEPGTTGAKRRSPSTSASDTRPISSVVTCVSPSLPSRSQSFSKKSPSPFSTPNSFGSWPTMIVSARPTMKPLSTGSEMKLARKPSREQPGAERDEARHHRQRRRQRDERRLALGRELATAAADSAAVADIGPTIRWRELPSSA